MPKEPTNHRKPVTKSIINQVRQLAKQNVPASVIAKKLGRTEPSIYGIARYNDISLVSNSTEKRKR